ncbi:hypothetical protein LTR62_004336 [Meristemomyces frigidus]|uniref:Uncharacterized protein n=1 Tax=Meristemomyces frigidus TaxID=1508187 RepID=A0AAN7TFA9_9PEZI|nr:hypothetical protein LTR62_004336 [Meristemomyces frigidus]
MEASASSPAVAPSITSKSFSFTSISSKAKNKGNVMEMSGPKQRTVPSHDAATDAGDEGEDADIKSCGFLRKKKRTLSPSSKDHNATPVKRTRRKSTKQTIASALPIAKTYLECHPADRRMLDMRRADLPWSEVKLAWETLAGEKVGPSTLPNRYARLLVNFAVVKEDDLGFLMRAKRGVDREWEGRKWGEVSDRVVELGGERYEPELLQRQYKKIMIEHGTVPPEGVEDPDFKDEDDA